ncbi:MAG: DUF4258 domain-containing protein [Chloroflexota bacterium]
MRPRDRTPRIHLTRHARNKMRRYGITTAELEALLVAPARQEPRSDGTPSALGTIRGRTYRVVYVIERDLATVITVWNQKE